MLTAVTLKHKGWEAVERNLCTRNTATPAAAAAAAAATAAATQAL
jgi:hypothetical protein